MDLGVVEATKSKKKIIALSSIGKHGKNLGTAPVDTNVPGH